MCAIDTEKEDKRQIVLHPADLVTYFQTAESVFEMDGLALNRQAHAVKGCLVLRRKKPE